MDILKSFLGILLCVSLIVILFNTEKLMDKYQTEIHQKGGLKGAIERIWEGEKKK